MHKKIPVKQFDVVKGRITPVLHGVREGYARIWLDLTKEMLYQIDLRALTTHQTRVGLIRECVSEQLGL